MAQPMRVEWSKGGRSYTHAGTLMRPRTMTKARDLEEGVDWLSGARDLEAINQCFVRTNFEGD